MAVLQQFPLYLVELLMGDPDRRKHRLAGFAILADDEVSAAKVFEVIGECTKRANDGIRIPAGLEFDAFDLHDTRMKQVVDANWQPARENSGRGLSLLRRRFRRIIAFLSHESRLAKSEVSGKANGLALNWRHHRLSLRG